jgi:hypothetical protein
MVESLANPRRCGFPVAGRGGTSTVRTEAAAGEVPYDWRTRGARLRWPRKGVSPCREENGTIKSFAWARLGW